MIRIMNYYISGYRQFSLKRTAYRGDRLVVGVRGREIHMANFATWPGFVLLASTKA